MLEKYAHRFLEATRFTANTRPDPHTQRHLDDATAKRERHARLWSRRPYWA
ncbi:hypothetical protein [Roseibium sp. M-1]